MSNSVAHYFRQENVNPVMYLNVDSGAPGTEPTRLSPNEHQLARIRELFHGLIRSRAREGGIPEPKGLPRLDDLVVDAEDRRGSQ